MALMQREITMRFFADQSDMNILGKVHGGSVMKWIDLAGYACAAGWCSQHCVTVYVGGIRFHEPILVGSIVQVHAKLIHTGTSSMHIAVTVSARDPREEHWQVTTRCIIVFVAIDQDGRPVTVPSWVPETQEDRDIEQYAIELTNLRKGVEQELQRRLSATLPR